MFPMIRRSFFPLPRKASTTRRFSPFRITVQKFIVFVGISSTQFAGINAGLAPFLA
jgi:hypothetical protein